MLTSEQVRGARAMLRLEQSALAERAGVSLETIKRMEKIPGRISALAATLDKVQRAPESAGAIFVEKNGEGPGVRLRKSIATAPDAGEVEVVFVDPRSAKSHK